MRDFLSDGDGVGSGGAGPPDIRHAALMALVANLDDLTNPDSKVNKPGSDDFAIALHEEDSRAIVLWAVLRPFLKAYAKAFPETATPPLEAEISASIDVMLDQGNFFLTQALIKRHLRLSRIEPLEDKPLEDEPLEDEPLEDESLEDEPPEDEPPEEESLSLGKLAELRYPRLSAGWDRYKHRLATEIFDKARDTQLWHVDVIGRVARNGGGSIARWKIKAGPALVDFDRYVYQPKRAEQIRQFNARFRGQIKEN